jgi:hypothetical protein
MKTWMLLASALALISSSGAHAQTAPAPDPVKLQLARELFEVSGGRQGIEAYLNLLYDNIGKLVEQTMPDKGHSISTLMINDMKSSVISITPQLIDSSIPVYAQIYTEQELRDYLAWLKSDSGQAILRKAPLLRQQILDAEMPILRGMLPGMMHKVIDHTCDESKCTAQDRQVLNAVVDAMTKGAS